MISNIEDLLNISNRDIKKIIAHFHSEMRKGLSGKKSSLAMIPAFVNIPSGNEKGTFIALDLGGTNFRILKVTLDGRGNIKTSAESKFRLEKKDISGTGTRLFDFIADKVKKFLSVNKFNTAEPSDLGFTFSFPLKQIDLAKGILLCWNKGFSAKNVIGKDVVKLLSEALNRKGIFNVRAAALVNDTVGTLAAKRYTDHNCSIGIIFGTGTNASYFEKIANIKKAKGLKTNSGHMAINIEWGNFNKLPRTIYDKKLDVSTSNPGRQWLEKMVSGLYLGEIARIIVENITKRKFLKPGQFTTEHVSEYSTNRNINLVPIEPDQRDVIQQICQAVMKRSARISAAVTAAVILWIDPKLLKKHTAAIDGSLFEKWPEYRKCLKSSLRDILGKRAAKITLTLAKDGSGIGAAIIAATASK